MTANDNIIFIDQIFESIRKDYTANTLTEDKLLETPMKQFYRWLEEAYDAGLPEPNAFSLATVNEKQQPNMRMVLLKAIQNEKLIFFSNYDSHKAREIAVNNKVSLLFFWPQLERQVRIQGTIEKTPVEISETYFESRPFVSRLGALVSQQSTRIESRQVIEDQMKELEVQSLVKKVTCPDYWGGYQITPFYYEFWQGRRSRLHDRLVFELKGKDWEIYRLSP